jgi:hypothetical protein
MKKIIASFFLSFLPFFYLFSVLYAQSNFEITENNEYKVQDSGTTQVTDTISIKNLGSNFYPKQFILTLSKISPENIKAYETGRLLKVDQEKNDDITTLKITFDQVTVGKENTKTFVVTYEDKSLAKKTGEIWEITIPKVENSESYKEIKSVLSVPVTFGDEAYISPEPSASKQLSDRRIYTFSNEEALRLGVTAGFGKFQAFSFKLTYHLQNTNNKKKDMEIALPPDTSIQRVFYENIDPKPKNVTLDPDGNWIALYNVDPNSQKQITVDGSVQIFSSPRKLLIPDGQILTKNIQPTSYWQSDDPEIKKIAEHFKTPKEIFDYVTTILKYDSKRIDVNTKRLGAVTALQNPYSALCSEYTDTFIAIARAAGFPAREINGYAYSQNPDVEPLSLVTDVLHAWPEYWNSDKQMWIPIDPTWASTTGGTDFFDKFDLRHFAFVIHGQNSALPYSAGSYKLGSTPEKDVYVTFGTLPEKKYPDIRMNYYFSGGFPLLSRKLEIKIRNMGTSASYANPINVSIDGSNVFSDMTDAFLPYSEYNLSVNVPYGLLASKISGYILVNIAGRETKIPTNKTNIIINQVLFISIILILCVSAYLIYVRRLSIKRIFLKKRDFDIFKKD